MKRVFICGSGHIFATEGETPEHCASELVEMGGFFGKEIKRRYICQSSEIYEIPVTAIKQVDK